MQPYLAGIFAATLFLVGWNWFFTVLPYTLFTAGMSSEPQLAIQVDSIQSIPSPASRQC